MQGVDLRLQIGCDSYRLRRGGGVVRLVSVRIDQRSLVGNQAKRIRFVSDLASLFFQVHRNGWLHNGKNLFRLVAVGNLEEPAGIHLHARGIFLLGLVFVGDLEEPAGIHHRAGRIVFPGFGAGREFGYESGQFPVPGLQIGLGFDLIRFGGQDLRSGFHREWIGLFGLVFVGDLEKVVGIHVHGKGIAPSGLIFVDDFEEIGRIHVQRSGIGFLGLILIDYLGQILGIDRNRVGIFQKRFFRRSDLRRGGGFRNILLNR